MKSNSVAPAEGEADLDLLDADLADQVEEAGLLLAVHRIDQRLVAVAQIGREPARRLGDGARRPFAVGQIDLREGAVFGRRVTQHISVLAARGRRSGRKRPLGGSRAPEAHGGNRA
jgi:hypothetical protein